MGFFTGNTGAMWIASYVEDGALNLADISVNFTKTTAATTYAAGSTWDAITVTGGGKNAKASLKTAITTSTTASTTGTLTITAGGSGYSAGDTIKFAKAGTTTPVLTDSFSVATTTTAGIDSVSELVNSANRIGKLKTWSLDISNDVLDTSVLGSAGKTFIAGPTTATGSATLMYYKEDLGNTTNMSDMSDLSKIIFNSTGATRVLLRLGIDASSVNRFDLYAWITGASLSSNYGEIVAVDVSFQMDGQFINVPS